MVDNNIVDDYYSKIDEKKGEDKIKAPIKVVPKKKIVVKKVEEKKDVISGTEWQDEKKSRIKLSTPKKPKIVQKIEVVQKEDVFVVKKIDLEWPKQEKIVEKKFTIKWDSTRKVEDVKPKSDKSFFDNKPNKPPVFKGKKQVEEEKDFKKQKFKKVAKTRGKIKFIEDWEEMTFIRSNKLQKHKKEEKNIEDIKQNLVEKRWAIIKISDALSVKELSEKIWIILPKLIAEFMKNWMMVNINSKIDFEAAAIIAESFEIKLERDDSVGASVEEIMLWNITSLLFEDDLSKLISRSPVISIMGHVDHGKTSLLDYIRKSKVAQGEAGWITQSIWAYQVELYNWNITVLDTPWHEAFTVMRSRWAKSTDIAILVVAADEWVKPQTIESINHAKQAEIPIIVAINKMDKEGANPEFVKWQLAEQWLVAENWGWNVPMVPVSALTWYWIDELLEIVLLVAEMKELKANPNRNGVWTVLESHLDSNLWPIATVLINTWTIKSGDNIVCGSSYWKVKVLKNYLNQKIKLAKPWEPVLIVGLDKIVEWWDILQVVNTIEIAKNRALEYKSILEKQKKSKTSWLELLMLKIKSGNLKQLKIVLKADTNGSLEAIKVALLKLSTLETEIIIIHTWVWAITEWDILMSQWNGSILVWFWVWVLPTAKSILENSWTEFIASDIIYHITERIEKIITWMLDLKEIEVKLWRSKVGWVFYTDKKFMILGLLVPAESKVENNALARILRQKRMIWTWKIESLKEWKIEVKEVEWPNECWIKFVSNAKVEVWDELEIYKIEKQK